jgi:hypothetical protein
MCVIFTCQHIGIILTIIGTVCLAFSIKTETQYTGDKLRGIKGTVLFNDKE